MKVALVTIAVFISLFQCSTSTLKVYLPSCAAELLPKPLIYTLSNFGEVPYGQTLVGALELPVSPELCDLSQEVMKPTKPSHKQFMLVKRGGCKFAEKVINAQKLGADLVIIYDNVVSPAIVVMKNDGHGHLVTIPSVFIGNQDGEAILKAINTCKSQVVMRLQVEIFETQVASVKFWLDSGNRETYVLARDFYDNGYKQALASSINYTISFNIVGTCNFLFCLKENCLGNSMELYCINVERPKDQSIPFVSGREIIYEQLRSYFLFQIVKNINDDLWWQYMIQFDERVCFQEKDIQSCSTDAMLKVGLNQNEVDSIKASKKQAEEDAEKGEESVLRQWLEGIDSQGVLFFPQVSINGRMFFGLFRAAKIFETICQSLISQPKQCFTFSKNKEHINVKGDDEVIWPTVLLIILLMTVGFICALLIYTKLIRKELNQQMSSEVNQMVESHYNMNDSQQNENYKKI